MARVEDAAFQACKNLREVVFEEGSRSRSIGVDAFCGCRELAKVTLPERLEMICRCAFQ